MFQDAAVLLESGIWDDRSRSSRDTKGPEPAAVAGMLASSPGTLLLPPAALTPTFRGFKHTGLRTNLTSGSVSDSWLGVEVNKTDIREKTARLNLLDGEEKN